jgi:hypothetical protein
VLSGIFAACRTPLVRQLWAQSPPLKHSDASSGGATLSELATLSGLECSREIPASGSDTSIDRHRAPDRGIGGPIGAGVCLYNGRTIL